MHPRDQTIFALSSGRPPSAIAIVRVWGPGAGGFLPALAGFENGGAAEPGEFTRGGFENGNLDLTEAEGLDDLIHADTDRQRRQALRQLKGLLGDKARDWRAQIIEASALIEAGIDFSDEGDVPAELMAPAMAKIRTLLGDIQ